MTGTTGVTVTLEDIPQSGPIFFNVSHTTTGRRTWNVKRRYKELEAMVNTLQKIGMDLPSVPFPPKHITLPWQRLPDEVLEGRRQALQDYLSALQALNDTWASQGVADVLYPQKVDLAHPDMLGTKDKATNAEDVETADALPAETVAETGKEVCPLVSSFPEDTADVEGKSGDAAPAEPVVEAEVGNAARQIEATSAGEVGSADTVPAMTPVVKDVNTVADSGDSKSVRAECTDGVSGEVSVEVESAGKGHAETPIEAGMGTAVPPMEGTVGVEVESTDETSGEMPKEVESIGMGHAEMAIEVDAGNMTSPMEEATGVEFESGDEALAETAVEVDMGTVAPLAEEAIGVEVDSTDRLSGEIPEEVKSVGMGHAAMGIEVDAGNMTSPVEEATGIEVERAKGGPAKAAVEVEAVAPPVPIGAGLEVENIAIIPEDPAQPVETVSASMTVDGSVEEVIKEEEEENEPDAFAAADAAAEAADGENAEEAKRASAEDALPRRKSLLRIAKRSLSFGSSKREKAAGAASTDMATEPTTPKTPTLSASKAARAVALFGRARRGFSGKDHRLSSPRGSENFGGKLSPAESSPAQSPSHITAPVSAEQLEGPVKSED